uniref:SCP domain-containing protein n=1 Tax=Parascaris univalens TaxID=6257 RepID=A0A915BXR5_PARUN
MSSSSKVLDKTMLLLAITLITVPLSGGVECPNVENATFDAESRDAVVNRHNELRSTLAFGTAVYKGGELLRSGKNIYQLRWDCDLEKLAQGWADKKVFQHSPQAYRQAGENIFQSFKSGNIGTVAQNAVAATNAWWAELKKYNASSNVDNKFTGDAFSVAGHWTQQAWGATRQIGCGVSMFRKEPWNTALVVCLYRAQ